jgi:hypothetical protein
MEKEREEKIKLRSSRGKKGKETTLLFDPLPTGGFTHHDFENDY